MNEPQTGKELRFAMQRTFLKRAILEFPGSPGVFSIQQFQPELVVNFDTEARKVPQEHGGNASYEVILAAHVVIKDSRVENKELFVYSLALELAGIFTIEGLEGDQLRRFLMVECCHFLYPYLREQIDAFAVRASLPPILLPPHDFNKLYEERLQKEKEEKEGKGDASQSSKDAELEKLQKELAMLRAQQDLKNEHEAKDLDAKPAKRTSKTTPKAKGTKKK